MPTIQYQISVRRVPDAPHAKWRIQVSTNRRGVFIESGDLPSKAEATRIARCLFRLNREADYDAKGLNQWVEER